jgi:hypothetical protein
MESQPTFGSIDGLIDRGKVSQEPLKLLAKVVMPTYQAGNATFNMGDFHINTGNDSTQVNVPQLQKVLQAQIQATIKQERRPGGSLNTNAPGLYDRKSG